MAGFRTHPERNQKYVALKILVAQPGNTNLELRILHHLHKSESSSSSREERQSLDKSHVSTSHLQDGSQYVTQLLDEFEHQGPNGTHLCLGFEAMGPNLNAMVEELPEVDDKARYPLWMAKSILKQSLHALQYLHSEGIAHGDLQPGNILFTLDEVNQTEESLRQPLVEGTSISAPVRRLDGQDDASAPRYLCIPQPLMLDGVPGPEFKVKLSDMGGGKSDLYDLFICPCWVFNSVYSLDDCCGKMLGGSPYPRCRIRERLRFLEYFEIHPKVA